jgi:hypothetical protein
MLLLQDPYEGGDPSCNHSIAGEMGSCLRRNLELPRMAPPGISFGIVSSEPDVLSDPCDGRDPLCNHPSAG